MTTNSERQIQRVANNEYQWKGFQKDSADQEPEVGFNSNRCCRDDEINMTSMVDVTFLLLIFFMVTASFTFRKSFEQAHWKTDSPSPKANNDAIDDDFVEVIIDQNNTFYVRIRGNAEIEAPSDRELRDVLREVKDDAGADKLVIRAHVDALHRNVVKVLDFGNMIGMKQIQTQISELEL